jgi:DMSO/TMAO reductase YedYZ molybdopterin-dependent catalytic subunit
LAAVVAGVAAVGAVVTLKRRKRVRKPVPKEFFRAIGSGTEFETRPSAFDGLITPNQRFYVRSHSPTPSIEMADYRLKIYGTGVERAIELTYEELEAMPQVMLTRTIECAGNGRRFFKDQFGKRAEGGQWGLGAMGCAEWTGVRLRDVLAKAGVKPSARDVMPIGLDKERGRRPMPMEKAMRDDTLLVLKMNGEKLPIDHGYPVRAMASGWVGAASIKWVGAIEIAEEALYSPFNTEMYVMTGPEYESEGAAPGPAITEMPVISALDLDWPAELSRDVTVIRGRSFAGEATVSEVLYNIDGGEWKGAELDPTNIEGCWRRWSFRWEPTPGKHQIRVRATDDRGRTQPDAVPWNDGGYLYNAVVAHPVVVR